ncbi:MAG: AraC family transcriptional regulator [Anaerostipes sp.]|nr:AraC family transcriptional regulator [Anaerostipes sp.]
MICNEPGVLDNSHYFFFSPPEEFLLYHYGVVNCGHFYCQYGYRIQREGHAYPLLIYVKEGTLNVSYQDISYIGKKNDIILLNCANPHSYFVDPTCEFYYFHFTGGQAYEITDALLQKHESPIFTLPNAKELFKKIKTPITNLSYEQVVSDAELSCMTYHILCSLQASGNVFTTNAYDSNDVVCQTILYIQEHLDASISLENLASNANLSVYYFSHIFKEETGISPIEFVAIRKINYAKSILKTTENSISQITDMLGYSSDSSFINAFKKRVGISPARFRKHSD